MFNRGQTETLEAILKTTSISGCIPQDKKPVRASHYPDLHNLNHLYYEIPEVTQIRHSIKHFGDK